MEYFNIPQALYLMRYIHYLSSALLCGMLLFSFYVSRSGCTERLGDKHKASWWERRSGNEVPEV